MRPCDHRPAWPLRRARGFLAALAALAVLATPVQCSLAMGAHSLFVDPRAMKSMADVHDEHQAHTARSGHSDHSSSGPTSPSHHEAGQQIPASRASALPRLNPSDNVPSPTGASSTQLVGQSSQVSSSTLRQFSGFVDAAPPVALGTPSLTLVRQWSPAPAPTVTQNVPKPLISWAESPPPP